MNSIQAIQDQLRTANFFTRMALKGLTESQWQTTPETLGTNVNWQFGHLLMGNYHFGIQLIIGDKPDLFDLGLYSQCYHRNTNPLAHWDIRPGKPELLIVAQAIETALAEVLNTIQEIELDSPVSTFNPAVTTKHAALLFCGSHQMYHNGQLGLLRKALLRSEISSG